MVNTFVYLKDISAGKALDLPVFTEPKIWEKPLTVNANQPSVVNFVISSKEELPWVDLPVDKSESAQICGVRFSVKCRFARRRCTLCSVIRTRNHVPTVRTQRERGQDGVAQGEMLGATLQTSSEAVN